jgi:hypothetical protein
VALAVVGIVPGVVLSISGGTWVNLALYLTTVPLSAGLVDTALLVAGAVLARLWLGGGDGDEVWAARPAPRADEAEVHDDATDADSDAAPPVRGDARPARVATPDGDRSTVPVVPTESPVVPARPTSAPDEWSRFAPPSAPREGER